MPNELPRRLSLFQMPNLLPRHPIGYLGLSLKSVGNNWEKYWKAGLSYLRSHHMELPFYFRKRIMVMSECVVMVMSECVVTIKP